VSHGYRPVQWTPAKRRYDFVILCAVMAWVAAFLAFSLVGKPEADSIHPVQAIIAATGSGAVILLTLLLLIGPLARLSPRFLPLLYNRRHLGVSVFLLGLLHAGLATLWFHGFGSLNPFLSILISNPRVNSVAGFPFELPGLLALQILALMAATSHDFWNRNLGPGLWKSIHLAVYPAYALLAGHVALGAAQGDASPLLAGFIGVGALTLTGLHVIAGRRELRRDRAAALESDGWLTAGRAADIPDGKAIMVSPPGGERIAVFRDGDRVFALSNICRHQGGPLGEGRIVDGLVTCPWHGYQYRPEDGCSPPPFTEKVPTYQMAVRQGILLVDPRPLPAGSERPILRLTGLPRHE
jgi:methionine sulfoxide reductase heme-binding subunit